jgi:predicted ATP-dependent endonuclease of OLD family
MEKITISNFRKVKETWELNLAPITFLTGTNNSGKSSVMKALMLLDGFGNSKNHFELNFNSKHAINHKVDCFSNAINRQNFKEKLWDIHFSIENNDYFIDYHFYPLESLDDRFEKGKLKSIKFTSKHDNSIFIISNLAGDEYQLTIDNSFIRFRNNHSDISDDEEDEITKLQEILLENEKELEKLQASIKIIKDESILTGYPKYLKTPSVEEKIKRVELNIRIVNKKLKALESNKKGDDQQFNPIFNLNDFEGSESIDKVLRRTLSRYFRENEKEIGLINNNREMARILNLSDIIVDALKLNISHLTPNRNTQTRLYVNDSRNNDIYDIIKSLSENPIRKKSKADDFIKRWMSKNFFDIGEDYNIKPIEGLASKIEIKENGDWINLVDKGFGAGQIFTILLRIADVINEENLLKNQKRTRRFRTTTPLILIEEPEANLHPAFQSKLAELFFETWKEFGIQFIVETHSEYIIRNSQLLFLNYSNPDDSLFPAMQIQHNPFVVYYFDKDGPYEMKYENDGSFNKPFGEGFLDVVDDIALEIFLKNNKQS